jgi:hypothetical protein
MVSRLPTEIDNTTEGDGNNENEELTGFGDGINLPPLRRSYAEINSSLGRTILSMNSISEQLDHAIGRIDYLLSENRMNRLPSVNLTSPNITITGRNTINSSGDTEDEEEDIGVRSPRPHRQRLQRMPSLENLRSIDCEIKARELAQCFPNGVKAFREYTNNNSDTDYFVISEDMPDR